MLDFAEAQASLLRLARRLERERVALGDADRRWLAAAVVSEGDLPPFDYSTMDGYAVAAREVSVGEPIPVAGESRTGLLPPPRAAGTVMRIFTGAPIPEGADAVIPQEDATREGDRVRFAKAPKVGACLRRRGDDRRRGDTVMDAGAALGPAQLALLASVDVAEIEVAKLPRLTVLTTGDELRDPGSPNVPGTIPDSNAVALATFFARAPAKVTIAPRVRDDAAATEAAIREALETSDVLVVVGGMSVGDHDVVRGALAAAGVDIAFWRVAIKPGKPLAVGTTTSGVIVVGLPGNPASALVTGALFVVPLLRAMQGAARPFPLPRRAPLTRAVERDPGRLEFLRARGQTDGSVEVLVHQASGAAWNMATADCLVLAPKECASLAAGTPVDVLGFAELGL